MSDEYAYPICEGKTWIAINKIALLFSAAYFYRIV